MKAFQRFGSAPAFLFFSALCCCLALSLAACESCTLEISLAPDGLGEFSDGLHILSNAAGSPSVVSLRGQVIREPIPVLLLGLPGLLLMLLGAGRRLQATRPEQV